MEPLFRNDSCSKGSPGTGAKQARRVQQIRLRGDQLPGGKVEKLRICKHSRSHYHDHDHHEQLFTE